ncbi:MAG: DUF4262 domain-containing protein [Adhaeribacter sp.]
MMTDEQIKEYFEKVDKNIKESGYHLTNIFATSETPSFCYSTGIFKSFNIPEVFISSLPPGLCSEIIENYVEVFKERKEIPINERFDLLTNRFPVYLIDVPVSNLKDYVLSSIRIYGNEEYKYLQVIYPDTQGNFPNDAGYDYD